MVSTLGVATGTAGEAGGPPRPSRFAGRAIAHNIPAADWNNKHWAACNNGGRGKTNSVRYHAQAKCQTAAKATATQEKTRAARVQRGGGKGKQGDGENRRRKIGAEKARRPKNPDCSAFITKRSYCKMQGKSKRGTDLPMKLFEQKMLIGYHDFGQFSSGIQLCPRLYFWVDSGSDS